MMLDILNEPKIELLNNREIIQIEGGTDTPEAMPGSYEAGRIVGTVIRIAFTSWRWIGVSL